VLLDAVVGNRESLPLWRKALLDYAAEVAAATDVKNREGRFGLDPAELSSSNLEPAQGQGGR
jgi:hypothetical protein